MAGNQQLLTNADWPRADGCLRSTRAVPSPGVQSDDNTAHRGYQHMITNLHRRSSQWATRKRDPPDELVFLNAVELIVVGRQVDAAANHALAPKRSDRSKATAGPP